MEEIVKKVIIFMRAGSIEANPPLSTILGNLGLNTNNFCKEFNDFSKELPNYFLLKVEVSIFNDRSFKFFINEPSSTLLINLVLKKNYVKIKKSGGIKINEINVINLFDFLLISKFKFGSINEKFLRMLYSSVLSSGIKIIK